MFLDQKLKFYQPQTFKWYLHLCNTFPFVGGAGASMSLLRLAGPSDWHKSHYCTCILSHRMQGTAKRGKICSEVQLLDKHKLN